MDSFPLEYTAPTVIPATENTRMVKSVTLNGHGQFRRIKVEETPLEDELKSDHVEVDVHYCGLNFTDNYLRLGIIRNNKFPVIMGSECSGIVTRVGNDITDLEVGQKVLCLQMQGGLFRRVVHVPRKYCFNVPGDTDLKKAVAVGLNFLVAHVCLFEFGGLRAKNNIFMQSIGGGVGTAVVELARTIPLVRVFGCASRWKHKRLAAQRVDRAFEIIEDYVYEITQSYPQGLDIVINCNGGSEIEKCFQLLKRNGILINIGSNSTAIYPKTKVWGLRPTWDTKYISSAELVSRNFSVAGLNIGRFIETQPKLTQAILTELYELLSIGEISEHVHAVLPLEKVMDGISQLCERKNYGKIILDAKMGVVEPEEPPQQVPEFEVPRPESPAEEPSKELLAVLEEELAAAALVTPMSSVGSS